MSKRQEKKKEISTIVSEDPIVLVRVVNNFNDATDNERFISAGPNTFYRTNKSRADMLVEAGYAEYEEVELTTVVEDSVNSNEDPNASQDPNAIEPGTNDNEDPNE